MKPKALFVEDDLRVTEVIKDILDALGHEYDHAPDLETARDYMAKTEYSYVLLDREIPVRHGRMSRILNGDNLFEEMVSSPALKDVPLIIVTGNDVDGPDKGVDMVKAGAFDYIAKPFKKTGKTLDRVIKKALGMAVPGLPADAKLAKPVRTRKFEGGSLAIFNDRAELCGVKIITDRNTGQTFTILRTLAQKDPKSENQWIKLSGEALVSAIGADGIGTITGAIRNLRKNCSQRLKKEMNVKCGSEDVIMHDEQGYRLREWITMGEEKPTRRKPAKSEDNTTATVVTRRKRIEQELRKSGGITAVRLAEKIGVSNRTIARDIEAMISSGVNIVRDGPKKTGSFCIL